MIQQFKNPDSIRYSNTDRRGPLFVASIMLVFCAYFAHAVFDSTIPEMLRIGAVACMFFFGRGAWLFVKSFVYAGNMNYIELHTDRVVIRKFGKDESIALTTIKNARYSDYGEYSMIYLKVGDTEISIISHELESDPEHRDLFSRLQESLRHSESQSQKRVSEPEALATDAENPVAIASDSEKTAPSGSDY